MKKFCFTIILGIFTTVIFAQDFSIRGRLTDASGDGLPSATVLLLNARDSVMINFALSNTDGQFEIRNIRRGDYLLRLSYVGFSTVTFRVYPPEGNALDLGDLRLPDETKLLDEVTVTQERIPMRVTNDTIEYDALAFRPLPNEMVEDLLKRMPGMVVSSDGTVEAQGEQVQRVLVDGREFFGRDPRMATQNIAADAIEAVQVFDQRSEQAIFTGIDDGERERTINLELKEDRREAAFGNTSFGYGPNNRFQGRTNLNRFDNNGQISLLGMGNNVNQQGFSTGDFMNFSGASQNRGGGGGGNQMGVPVNFDGRASSNGMITTWAGGVNFNRRMDTGTEITASYFYNQMQHDMREDLERENFLPEGNFNYNQNLLQDNQNFNHRINFRLNHRFSERASLLFTGYTSLNMSDMFGQTSGQTFGINDALQNSTRQINNSEGENIDIDASLLWRQRLAKPGRTFTAEIEIEQGNNRRDLMLDAENQFFGQTNTEEAILQGQYRDDWNREISADVSFTEPLAENLFLEGNYDLSFAFDEVNLRVLDIEDPSTDGVLNNLLSNHYENSYIYHRAGLNIRLNQEGYNIMLGSALQSSDLRGYSFSLDQPVTRNYLHFLPVARFNYEFNSFRRFSAEYETSVREPSASQIQPVIDSRNPLNVFQGNPGLLPSYRHRMQMRLHSFNPATSFGFFINLSAEYIHNAITNSVNVDEFLVQTTMPVNVDNNINFRGNFNMNIDITSIKSRIMAGTSISQTQSVNILNGISQQIVNNMLTPNIRYVFTPIEPLEIRLMASVNNQLTRYEFRATEQAFLNQTYQSELSLNFLKHYRIEGSYTYSIFQGRTSEFDRTIPMLNASFSRNFLRNNSGELRLSAFNLLNSEMGVNQITGVNYYQRSVTNSLGRYFLLSFTYSLNQQLNMVGGPMGPGQRGGRGMR